MKTNLSVQRLFTICVSLLITQLVHAQNCTANAGLDQTICVTQPLTLVGTPGSPQATTPAYLWTQVSGPSCTITTNTTTTTTVTGFTPGNYVFQFSNKCIDNFFALNLVSVTVLPEPPTAIAGDDVANCSNTPVVLAANAVSAPFTGTWTVSPNVGSFSPNINTANATYTPPAGSNTYTLTWTISNGFCSIADTKILKVVTPISPVSAGSNQTLTCNGNCVTLAGSSPGVAPPQSGFWTFVSGPSTPVFSNPNSATSTACNLVPGVYVLSWSVSGPCLTGTATVTITVSNIFTAPAAGGNQSYTTFCGSPAVTSQVLTGAALTFGETGLWAQTGGGTPPYPNVSFVPGTTGSNVTVTGLTGVFPYIFTYVKTNAAGCTNSSTHTVYRSPSILNLTDPPNKDLTCDVQSTTFTMNYDDLTNITTGLTRTGVRIASPAAVGTASFTSTVAAAGTRTDTWTASGMTTAGTYIYRMEYRNSCGSVFKDIAITVSRTPGAVNAGSNPVLPCNTLFANPIGSASLPTSLTWSQVSGPNTATLSGINTVSLNMTGLLQGIYRMRLTNSGGAACGSITSDVFVKVVTAAPTIATTGSNGSVCSGNFRLSANTPGPLETGTWTVSPSTGISFSPNANTPNAFVSGMNITTAYTFTWTVSNSCGSIASSQVLTTTSSASAPVPNAGTDICRPTGSTTAALSGNAPAGATILWTALTAGSSISPANTQSSTANFTGGSGIYLFEYALSTIGCSTFTDTVAVTINNTIAAPNAGANQDICVVSLPASATLTATPSAPSGSTSVWTQLGGPTAATIGTANAATTTVSNMIQGIYEFEYRIKTGFCADVFDTVVLRIAQEPSTAVAGSNQSICSATTATLVTLAATAPVVGTGYWQVITGPAGGGTPTFSNQNLANSTISNLTQGTYTLRWTTFNGPVCAAKTSDMTIDITAAANAGVDFTLCDKTSSNLTGNPNTTGTWTLISGPGGTTITTNSPNTAVVTGLVSSLAGSAYTFRYTLPIVGACPSTFDDVLVTNYAAPSAADAGLDQQLCFNNTDSIIITGNTPTTGTGTWVRISGPNTPTAGSGNGNLQDTTLKNLIAGLYIYEYRVNTNAICVVSADRMQILKEVTANAGIDQRFCNVTTASLAGNAPVVNAGTWTYVSGPAGSSFVSANNPATTVNGLVAGTYIFAWTIAGPGGCTANSDNVQIIIDPPVPAIDAGADQSFCEGTVVSFALGAAAQGGVTYTWTPAVLLSNATVAQPNFTGVNNAGKYTYTVKGNIGSCEAFDAVTITVNPKPGANINIAPILIGYGCASKDSATDVGNGVNGPITYTWSFGTVSEANPATGNGAGPFTVNYLSVGPKNISLTVTSADGCTNNKTTSYSNIACTLPITLISFNAGWKTSFALVEWKVADAVNFDHFELERSYDGTTFIKISSISYTSSLSNYSYEDRYVNISTGKVFYRVKLVDINGSYTYSETRLVYILSQDNVIVAPNPFTEKIGIWFKGYNSVEKITLKLLNNIGQAVMVKEVILNAGDRYIEITDLKNISSGMYNLQIIAAGRFSSYKLLKK